VATPATSAQPPRFKETIMTTTALHLRVQRDRFSHHVLAAIVGIVPAALRTWALSAPPVMSAADRASREAQKVRELAYSYSKTDPGFASDLYAAAARHEGLHG
jgi:hypothetical protein